MASKSSDEAAKLTATYVNQLASGIALIGGIAPIVTSIYASNSLTVERWQLAAVSIVCFLVSAALHSSARAYLKRRLDE